MKTNGRSIVQLATAGLMAVLVAAGPRAALAEEAPLAPTVPTPSAAPQPAPVYVPVPVDPYPNHRVLLGETRYRSPGLAAALSLQPFPIDFGNLYAENLGWGVAYTAIEVSLMAPMMLVVGQHMDHGAGVDRGWSGADRGTMVGLVAGYVAVKLIAGLQAGYAARSFNQAYEPRATAFVAPAPGGAMLTWSGRL